MHAAWPWGRTAAVLAIVVAAAAVATIALLGHDGEPVGRSADPRLRLERDPTLGVACPQPNRIECGRIALHVPLREPVSRLEATVAGHRMGMVDVGHSPANARGLTFEGSLQRRGLISTDLRVRPDTRSGKWLGRRPAPPVEVRLTGFGPDGARLPTRTLRLRLAPGYG